jgi:hypothetical protein
VHGSHNLFIYSSPSPSARLGPSDHDNQRGSAEFSTAHGLLTKL